MLDNKDNYNYVGQVFIGTPLQEKLWVVWDTGSGSLLIKSSDCKQCVQPWLDIEKSDSFEYMQPKTKSGAEYLDGTKLIGYIATDQVCPSKESTDKDSCSKKQ